MSSVLIVAAEASSCLYAHRLLEHWESKGRSVQAFGIGDTNMVKVHNFEAQGLAEDLAVVGLQEVIKNFGAIKKTFNDIISEVETRKPDFALLLDYPGFNLRLAKKLKSIGVPVVYYISPQVWAWKKGRIKTIQKVVDKMLVLFPFEKDFYDQHGVESEFVGHPLIDELKSEYLDSDYKKQFREKYGIATDKKTVALMPGSRNSELEHHLQTQLDVGERLYKEQGAQVLFFVAPTFTKEKIEEALKAVSYPIQVIKDEPFKMILLADMVLCASGTATLLVALLETPMVIMYKMNAITAWLAKKLVNTTKYFGISNIIMDKEVSKELFQEQASVDNLVSELSLFFMPEKAQENSKQLAELRSLLGNKGATVRVAESVESLFK